MQLILRLLLIAEALVLTYVAYLGLMIDSVERALSHVVGGIFATVFTMFIHCLVLFYLNGSSRAIKEAAQGDESLLEEFMPSVRRVRKRAYPPATFALSLILCASFAGGWVHSGLIAEHATWVRVASQYVQNPSAESREAVGDRFAEAEWARLEALRLEDYPNLRGLDRAVSAALVFPVRRIDGWWVHLGILIPALLLNIWAFAREVEVVRENVKSIRRLNALLDERHFVD